MRPGYRIAPNAVLKPGSLLASGAVVDWRGDVSHDGPCFVPVAELERRPRRKTRLGLAGWFLTPARDWPSMLPAQGLCCIHRERRS